MPVLREKRSQKVIHGGNTVLSENLPTVNSHMMLSWASTVAMLEAEITSFDDTLAGSGTLRMFLVKTVNVQFYGIFPCSSVFVLFCGLIFKELRKETDHY